MALLSSNQLILKEEENEEENKIENKKEATIKTLANLKSKIYNTQVLPLNSPSKVIDSQHEGSPSKKFASLAEFVKFAKNNENSINSIDERTDEDTDQNPSINQEIKNDTSNWVYPCMLFKFLQFSLGSKKRNFC